MEQLGNRLAYKQWPTHILCLPLPLSLPSPLPGDLVVCHLWHLVHLARELRIERCESLPTGLKAPFTTCELVCCAYRDRAGKQAWSPHNEGGRQQPGKCQRNNPEKPQSFSASIAGREEVEEVEEELNLKAVCWLDFVFQLVMIATRSIVIDSLLNFKSSLD